MRVDSQRDVGRHCEGLCPYADKARGIGRIGAPRPTLSRVTTKRRQVSWLAGCRLNTAFPEPCGSSGLVVFGSPLTVAGAAAELRTKQRAHRIPILIPLGTVFVK